MSDNQRNHRKKKNNKYKGEYQPLDTKALMKELREKNGHSASKNDTYHKTGR